MIDSARASVQGLPKGWRWALLGELATFINGDRGKNYPSPSNRVASGIPFINTGHIDPNGRLSHNRMEYISRETFDNLGSGKVVVGDIVYCLRGSTIGKIARNEFDEGAIASSLIIIRSDDQRLQSFIYHYLSSATGQSLARKFDNGSAQPNLSAKILASYPVPLPTKADLARVSELLDALDDKIELNRRANETLEAMARAIFKDWFVDFGPTRAKVAGAAPYLAPDTWSLFPNNLDCDEKPSGWDVGSLGNVVEQRVERTHPSHATAELPYVPIDCIAAHTLALTESNPGTEAQSSLTKFHKHDILFGAMRPYFHKVCIAPFAGTTRTTVFVLHPFLPQDFSYACLLLHDSETIDYASRHSTGSTIPYAVWKETLERMPVVLPPASVRAAFDGLVRPMLMRLSNTYFENRSLRTMRDLLLPKLMSGEIRVKDAEKIVEEVA